ncbi:IclR family transcriptional regulator [Arthrobacter sp.]|uniref:IclR family transcriptional regulator n=1 Tax=Arthrobacter sp. TaxID=1667 RepID=UPI003A93DF35
MTAPDPASNRMLERISAILDALDAGPCTASELARSTAMSVSTVHRLAVSMVAHGFLRRHDDGKFALGHRFLRSALDNIALPHLVRLRDATGESAQLWVRRGSERICRLSVDSRHELRATLPEGARLQLPAGSAGRLLANEPEALESCARDGWLESSGRRTPGLGSVSVPIVIDSRLITVLCLAMPLARVNQSPGRDYGAVVVDAAAAITAELEAR